MYRYMYVIGSYYIMWCSNYVMDVFTVLLIKGVLAGKVLG